MFGFFKKSELRKLESQLSGYSLREVVEIFADKEITSPDVAEYNKDLVLLLESEMRRIAIQLPNSDFSDQFRMAREKLKMPPDVLLMVAASKYTDALRSLSMVTRAEAFMAIGRDDEEMAKWFFNAMLNRYGVNSLIPIIFTPRNQNGAEDFNLSTDDRKQLLSILVSRLKSLKQLKNILNEFAQEHPYFRLYPIKD